VATMGYRCISSLQYNNCFFFRLRASETQYRLEVDRLKADLQCDQVKFQHLERELTDLNFERTNIDNSSTNV
jgi:hypothetical protein